MVIYEVNRHDTACPENDSYAMKYFTSLDAATAFVKRMRDADRNSMFSQVFDYSIHPIKVYEV
jgi:hypothetical protein